jgi:MFS family permease
MAQQNPTPDPSRTGARPRTGALSPLRYDLYRALWIATLVSNFGTWIQQVGAAWRMTAIAPSPDMVALVQVATALPALILSLPGGAVSDVVNRRIVLLTAQSWMLVASGLLAALDFLGLVGPWTLLALTFALGLGGAFNGPAWQAAVGDLVPRREIPAAVALNSIGFNIARSLGPALGGLIVAIAGAKMAFLLNALSYIGVIVVLFGWSGPTSQDGAPPERVWGAMIAGMRFARQSPTVRTVLIRTIAFTFPTSAIWALLPLVAKSAKGGGPITYGLLLGSLGVGAILGAGIMPRLRQRFGNEFVVSISGVVFGLVMLAVGYIPYVPILMLLLLGAGAAWMSALSSINTTVQLTVPGWVKGRALSIYLMALYGGLTAGSWFWGRVATDYSLAVSLSAAGAVALASLGLYHRYHLPGFDELDLSPSDTVPDPVPAFDIAPDAGPVLITVEYRVLPERADEFAASMREIRRIRRRDGARSWDIHRDVEQPDRWLESFTVASWAEHLRQHRRGTADDTRIFERARAFHHGDAPPKVTHLIAQEPDLGRVVPMRTRPGGG